MKKYFTTWFFIFLALFSVSSQETRDPGPDELYREALEAYKSSDFTRALAITLKGLEAAPEYHDIRILKVRSLWALDQYGEADEELDFLLVNASEYPDLGFLLLQRLNRFPSPDEQLEFLEKIKDLFPKDIALQSRKADVLIKTGNREAGRKLARELLSLAGVSGAERYALQLILSRSTTNEVGVGYQYVGFSKDYPRNNSWHNITAEYLHNFKRTSFIGRVHYADRGYEQGMLYEIEAYPVFNDRFYAFTNVGISNGKLFPDVRTSLSIYYNFLKVFEAEAGARLQYFHTNSYFTGVAGLSLYRGKFYINARSFIGPKRLDQIDQNYQTNVRYYFENTDNYLFIRLGSGISPDERVLSTGVLTDPGLEAVYGMAGVNFSLGIHHLFQITAGLLQREISSDQKELQYLSNFHYRYRF